MSREAKFSKTRTGPGGGGESLFSYYVNHEQDWQPYNIRLMPNLAAVIIIIIADSAWVWRTSRLTREGTAETVSQDQTLRRERAQGNLHFPCPVDLEQDWQQFSYASLILVCDDHTYSTFNIPTSYQSLVWEREAHINWSRVAKAALVRNYLEVYWPCAGELSAVNAIGTLLRDSINSGLTRWHRRLYMNKWTPRRPRNSGEESRK